MSKLDTVIGFFSPKDLHGPFKYSAFIHAGFLSFLVIAPFFISPNKIYRGAGAHSVQLVNLPAGNPQAGIQTAPPITKPEAKPEVKTEPKPAVKKPVVKETPKIVEKKEAKKKEMVKKTKPIIAKKPEIVLPKPLETPDLKEKLSKKFEEPDIEEEKAEAKKEQPEWAEPDKVSTPDTKRKTSIFSPAENPGPVTASIGIGGQGNGTGTGSGGAGGPMAPYQYYLDLIQTKITSCWNEPKMTLDKDYVAIVSFTINTSGDVLGVFVKKSSGLAEFDKTGTEAVEAAKPFPPLPKGFFSNQLTVNVEFSLE